MGTTLLYAELAHYLARFKNPLHFEKGLLMSKAD